MRVLYITGSCLQCNTSANMSHNSFVQGLLENECEVDIIMSDSGLQEIDPNMPYWKEANYFIYKAVPKMDRLRIITKSIIDTNIKRKVANVNTNINSEKLERKKENTVRSLLKFVFYNVLTKDSPHYLTRKWLINASNFKSDKQYDLVISNSSPESSHALAERLLKNKNIYTKKWIQIWEDPWYYEFYNHQKKNTVLKEERRLLEAAEEIYYVSPITLIYQQKNFPNDSTKMKWIPLPYLKSTSYKKVHEKNKEVVFGYFGDYYSQVRNLKPFYEAAVEINAKVNIYGDSDQNFSMTENVNISERVDIGIVSDIQERSDVLIHLCNIRGGQIPGKIYHYSGTKKPIIFILDGEEEEKRLLKEYFGKFNRYHFCNNSKEEIKNLMLKFVKGEISRNSFIVEDFNPKFVVSRLIEKNQECCGDAL